MSKLVTRFLRNEDGATAIEYGLIKKIAFQWAPAYSPPNFEDTPLDGGEGSHASDRG